MNIRSAITFVILSCLIAGAQQPSGTWVRAKPFVDRWDADYLEAGRTIEVRERIVVAIRALLAEHSTEIWAYEAAALGFNHLNLNTQAVGVMRGYVRRFPEDNGLDRRVLFFFGNWGQARDLEGLPQRWHEQATYWQRLLEAYVREHAAPAVVERTGTEFLRRIPVADDMEGAARIQVAETWLANGVSPSAAERVVREALSISERDHPELSVSDAEQQIIFGRLLIVTITRSTLGWALYRQGRFAEALVELQRAADLAEKDKLTTRGVFFRLGQTCEKLGRTEEAIDAYFKEIAWGDALDETKPALVEVYRRTHGSLEGFDAIERSRINDLIANRLERAASLVRVTDEPLGRFDLLDSTGSTLRLDQFKGKIVIIDFWATWCGACRLSMQHTAEAQRRAPKDIVVVAPAADDESGHAKAAEFLKQKNYNFTLVWDDAKRRDIRLPYIPARLLLDRMGRLRFVELGCTPEGSVLFERRLNGLLNE